MKESEEIKRIDELTVKIQAITKEKELLEEELDNLVVSKYDFLNGRYIKKSPFEYHKIVKVIGIAESKDDYIQYECIRLSNTIDEDGKKRISIETHRFDGTSISIILKNTVTKEEVIKHVDRCFASVITLI